MFLVVIFIAIFAGVAYALYVNKKQINHFLNDVKYELRVQDIGFRAMIDDLMQKNNNKIREFPDVSGQVAVVTGGARGIGYHVVRHLVQLGMRVVLGVRNVEAGRKMDKEFKELKLAGSLDVYSLDVSTVKSVKNFARIVSKEYPNIHLLVNNAGIMFGEFTLTEDGFENQLATNYLGHFLLTHLLMPSLRSAGEKSVHPTRVVNVSSCAHKSTKIFLNDINMRKEYFSSAAYGQSKLAQVMSARYLDRLLNSQGARVHCYSVHPGVVNTDLFQGTSIKKYSQWFMNLFFKTPEQGAISILYTCLAHILNNQGGAYISNCRKGSDSKCSRNEDHQEKLFKITCDLLQVKEFGVVDK